MTEFSTHRALRELVAMGLVAVQPAPILLAGGNADRRDRTARTSWRVNLPDGRPVRLILGPRLAGLAKKQAAFARACPDLVPAPVFYQPLSLGDAFADLFIEGDTLEASAQKSPARVQSDFERTCTLLATTTRASTEADRQSEWLSWTQLTESLPAWNLDERAVLQTWVWPALYPLLSSGPPIARWSNGDFTSSNILLDQAGNPRLIDHEFAHETHFFTEDLARFHSLSPAARQRPELFSSSPLPGPAWHLFFWLRQLGLETAHNTAAYLERMRPARLSVIRRLSEIILGRPLAGWSVEPTTVQSTVEFARWEQTVSTALRITGWCHVTESAVRSLIVTQGEHLLTSAAPTSRPDVQTHFRGVSTAKNTGFSLAIPLRDTETPLILSALTEEGTILPFHSFLPNHLPGRGPWVEDYTRWAALYDPDPVAPVFDTHGPLFSVLVPTYNTPLHFLRACLESVLLQHYRHWELCIVDDGSSNKGVPNYLRQFASSDPRIRLQLLPANRGISRASNAALAMAEGQYVVMLDHDDLLRPHALLEFARYLETHPETDALYSDEDKLSPEGHRISPSFKPDFSPEYLLGVMYVGHALCVRTRIARSIGGFDPAYDGIQDYEFFLRVSEHTNHVGHVPRILYHWRQSPKSSSLHENIKGNIGEKQAAAVREHLLRRGRTELVQTCNHHRVQLNAARTPFFEVVTPTQNESPIAALNRMANKSTSDVLILITVEGFHTDDRSLGNLSASAMLPDSGLVAPLLLSPWGLVQESGWTLGLDRCVPIMQGFDPEGDGYMGSLLCIREVMIVSPVCVAVKRQLILSRSQTDLNWLDFCLQISMLGLFHRICPTARLQVLTGQERPAYGLYAKLERDPFFNPHFNPERGDYSLIRVPAGRR